MCVCFCHISFISIHLNIFSFVPAWWLNTDPWQQECWGRGWGWRRWKQTQMDQTFCLLFPHIAAWSRRPKPHNLQVWSFVLKWGDYTLIWADLKGFTIHSALLKTHSCSKNNWLWHFKALEIRRWLHLWEHAYETKQGWNECKRRGDPSKERFSVLRATTLLEFCLLKMTFTCL